MTATQKKELEGIKYLKENNDMNNPEVTLKIYNRIIEQNIFKTDVGIDYLRTIHAMLVDSNIDKKLIKPIPIVSFEEEADAEIVKSKERTVKSRPVIQEDKVRFDDRELKGKLKEVEKKKEKYRNLLINSVILNVILVLAIIGMFIIADSKNNPTILNYEEKLQNKYSSWEESLEKREQELNNRENSLVE